MRLKKAILTLEHMEQSYIDTHGKIVANGGAVKNGSAQRLAAVRYAIMFLQNEYDYLSRLRAEGADVTKKPQAYWDGFRQEMYGNMSPADIVEMMGE